MRRQSLIDQAIIARNLLQVVLPLHRLRASASRPILPETPTRFAIIAGDVTDPSSSLGDLAMFSALMQSLRAQNPDSTFTIIGKRRHTIVIPGIGETPVVPAWAGKTGTRAFDELIRQHHALFVMGADILDGKYGAALVQRIAAYCNHSVALGIPATMLGFSFNRHPRIPAVHALSRLHPKVTINIRDQPSLERFTRIVGIPARLCTDSAFLMPPATAPLPEPEAWIAAMRHEGRTPVGINLSAHALAPAIAQAGLDRLIDCLAEQFRHAGEQNRLAFMLLPHDLKSQSGDVPMLQALKEALQQKGFTHVRYTLIDQPDKIKRLTRFLDLVITGRMHLVIASLGSGTPALSITYQDKFEGLYQHFDLSLEHTITPIQCLSDAFLRKINDAFMHRHDNRARILSHLPRVKALASRNLAIATCDPAD